MSTSTSPATPSAVNWSFAIWVIGAILGLVSAVFLFIAAAGAGTVAAISGAGVAGLALIIVGIVIVLVAIFELVVVVKMRGGRNWARVLLTIFAVLQVVGTLTQGGNSSFWSWLAFAAIVIATILMFVPSANAYFAARRTRV